jgi:hypothetical protein
MTCAFTGRPARALRNGFVERHASAAIIGYRPCIISPENSAAARQQPVTRTGSISGPAQAIARPKHDLHRLSSRRCLSAMSGVNGAPYGDGFLRGLGSSRHLAAHPDRR